LFIKNKHTKIHFHIVMIVQKLKTFVIRICGMSKIRLVPKTRCGIAINKVCLLD